MNYFIIGDIHGCYYTLKEMLLQWDPCREKLMVLGDFVNKGKHTFAVLEYLIKLQEKYHDNVIILKGNNEDLFYEFSMNAMNLVTKQKFENYNLPYYSTLEWLDSLPHFWENEFIFLSHAGLSKEISYPVKESKNYSLITNRNRLKDINKTQFLGHVVVENPIYDESAQAWYIDTGAGFGKKLTAVRVSEKGKVKRIISLPVNIRDIAVVYQQKNRIS